VIDDFVHNRIVGEERNDLHLAAALRTEEGINFINLTDHLGPALGGDVLELLLHHKERESLMARLLDLSPVGIGVEAEVTDSDLSLVRNMGSEPGDKLQVIHPLHLFATLPIPVADLALLLIEREPLQGQTFSMRKREFFITRLMGELISGS